MLALIDADVLCYTSAFASQKTQYYVTYQGERKLFESAKPAGVAGSWKTWARDNNIPKEDCIVEPQVNVLPLDTALMIAGKRLDQIKHAVSADAYELHATGEGNFRETVAVTRPYKGNRKQEKPVHYAAVFDFYLRQGAQVVDGMEADDILAIRQTECERKSQPSCICSIDKDMWQVEGRHYNWGQDEGQQKFRVNFEKAHFWFMVQTLAGDATDNIPGLPELGLVKAKALLSAADTPLKQWELVKASYRNAPDRPDSSWFDYLAEQGRLVWMLRERESIWSIPYYEELLEKHVKDQG